MKSIFITKYSNLDNLQKNNSILTSKNNVLSLKKKSNTSYKSYSNIFASNISNFNNSKSRNKKICSKDFPKIETTSYLFKPKSERDNKPFKIKQFSLDLKSFDKNSFHIKDRINSQNSLIKYSSESNINSTFNNNQSIYSSSTQNNIFIENKTFNYFPNLKLTNFISFSSFRPKKTFDEMLKKLHLKKNKIGNLSSRSLKFNSINKMNINKQQLSPKNDKNIINNINQNLNEGNNKFLTKSKSVDLIIYENNNDYSENNNNNKLDIISEQNENYEKKKISNFFINNNNQVPLKKNEKKIKKEEITKAQKFNLKPKTKSKRVINPSKIHVEKPIKINMIEKLLNKKKNEKKDLLKFKENNQNIIKKQLNDSIKNENIIKSDLSKRINMSNLIKEKKNIVKRNNSDLNSKNYKFLSTLTLKSLIKKQNTENFCFGNCKKLYYMDDEDITLENKEKRINDLKENLKGQFKMHIEENDKKRHNTVKNMFRKNNSFKHIKFNTNIFLNLEKKIDKKNNKNSLENKVNKKDKKKKKKKKSSIISLIQARKDKKKKIKFKEENMDEISVLNSENIEKKIKTASFYLNKINTIEAKKYINEHKEEKAFINHLKNIIFMNKSNLSVPNPFENINITLITIKSELLNKEYEFEKEIKYNPEIILFNIYEFNKLNEFVKFLSLKYFDFYKEFVHNLSFKQSNNDINKIQNKLREINSKIINGKFTGKEIKTSLHIHKFIQTDILYNENDIKKSNEECIKNSKTIKNTLKYLAQLGNKPTKKKEKKNLKFQLYNFHRMTKKLEDYSCLRRKSSILKLLNLRPKQQRLSYIAFNEKYDAQQVFKQLKIYVIKNEFEKFKKLFFVHLFNIDLEECDEYENTLLMLSVIHNCKSIFDFLIDKGANINTQNIYLNTPLHYAFAHKNYKFVDKLIKNGANETIKNRFGQSYFESVRLEND